MYMGNVRTFTIAMITFLIASGLHVSAQDCLDNEHLVIIEIAPDDYPNETSWELTDTAGNILADGNSAGDSVCVDSTICLLFNIYDSFGDGICCTYGEGSYAIYSDGGLVANGGDFNFRETVIFNCPPGFSCESAVPVTLGDHLADHTDFWHEFTADTTGIYTLSTCGLDTCDTKLWIYARCQGVNASENNAGSIYYDDNEGGCGEQAQITAYLEEMHTYYIRIGSDNNSCTETIEWTFNFGGEVAGCMDTSSCNYNPLATIDDGSCILPGDTACGEGPDLIIFEDVFRESLRGDVLNNGNPCLINEGCLMGFGDRQLIRFTTHFHNIGDTDYFIGNAADQPLQFTYDNCHGHYHYVGYAEYRLYNDQHQKMSNGFKNGFCVSDLECDAGSIPKFGCASQGLTAGCGDYYSWVISCQWIDVTDVPDGDYTLVNTVNWDRSPDAVGNVEQRYDNNWGQACFHLSRLDDVPVVTLLDTCLVVLDCEGISYGDAVEDCAGICGGSNLYGDLNGDFQQTSEDAENYVFDIINGGMDAQPCFDLNADGAITVFDATLVNDCYLSNTAHDHSGGNNVQHHCALPGGIVNPLHTADLTILEHDAENKTIDIGIRNPQDHIKAYEFNMSGMEIVSVISLVDPARYPVVPQYLVGGNKIISISLTDSIIPKTNGAYQSLCRIQYITDGTDEICIESIVDIINEENHKINTTIIEGCVDIISSSTNLASGHNINVFPNPGSGLFSLRFKLVVADNITMVVYDQMGRKVSKREVPRSSEGTLLIDLTNEPDGIYTINFRSESGTSSWRVLKIE